MANQVTQHWDLPEGCEIHLHITSAEPFPEQVWKEDLPRLITSIDTLRIHLGGDL
jgi:hypothetical protein